MRRGSSICGATYAARDRVGGRLRRQQPSADLHAAQLSVVAETARTYLELRGVQEQLRIVRGGCRGERGSLLELDGGARARRPRHAARSREPAGAACGRRGARAGSCEQAAQQLDRCARAAARADAPGALDAQLAAVRHVLAHRRRGSPAACRRKSRAVVRTSARAEARLHAATAEIGVAVADLYPRITLTGGSCFSRSTPPISPDWGARSGRVGPSLSLAASSTAGAGAVAVELRELQQQEAAVNYQRTVLRAWHEIDDALSAYRAERNAIGRARGRRSRRVATPTRSRPSATSTGSSNYPRRARCAAHAAAGGARIQRKQYAAGHAARRDLQSAGRRLAELRLACEAN